MRLARMPLQSHTARETRPLLPSQLYPQGQEQLQVRPQGRSAGYPQGVEELRIHEAARRYLDRTGHRTIQPSSQKRPSMRRMENLSLSSFLLQAEVLAVRLTSR